MKPSSRTLIAAMLLCLSAPVLAQGGRAAEPPAAARDAHDAEQELTLTRLFARLHVSRDQAARLAPVLAQAQERLKDLDEKEAAALARLKGAAEKSRDQAAGGAEPAARFEQQLAEVEQANSTRRQGVRAELIALVRAALLRTLTQEQLAALGAALPAISQQDRTEQFAAGAGPGGFNGRPGGPGGGFGPEAMMDRLRAMPEDQWQAMRDRFNARISGNNPGRAQRGTGFMAFAERIRNMDPDVYARTKSQLADEFRNQNQNRGGGRTQQSGGPQADPDRQLRELIDRHLLQPAAVRAVRRRAGQDVS